MKLIITANTWEEEVRNATIDVLSDDLTLKEYKVITSKIARAIAEKDLEYAAYRLWVYSGKGYSGEHAKSLVESLRETYEETKN